MTDNESGQTTDLIGVLSAGAMVNTIGTGEGSVTGTPWQGGGESFTLASKWTDQKALIKITPIEQMQSYTYTSVSYLKNTESNPGIQMFPICDLKVTPHQVSFDFFDTTEGKIGVSNATEQHMIVECSTYITDYLYYSIQKGRSTNNSNYNNVGSLIDIIREEAEFATYKDFINSLGGVQDTTAFMNFRNNFLQQHSGWVCSFASNTFQNFNGVLTDVSYEIGNGEEFSKFNMKIEEAIFIEGFYNSGGMKNTEEVETTNGSGSNSGTENVSDNSSDISE